MTTAIILLPVQMSVWLWIFFGYQVKAEYLKNVYYLEVGISKLNENSIHKYSNK